MPGVYLETVHSPVRYTTAQIDRACAIAHHLKRGRFVLCEPPKR
jgi:hypothetical protein